MSTLTSQRSPDVMGSNTFASTSEGLATPAPSRFKHVPRITPSQLKQLQSQVPRGALPTPMSLAPTRSHNAASGSTDMSDEDYADSATPAEMRSEREAREAMRAQERDHSTGLIMKLEDLRARLNGNPRSESSDKSAVESSKSTDEERPMRRFSFKDLRDRGAAVARATTDDERDETPVARQENSNTTRFQRSEDASDDDDRLRPNGRTYAAHSTYPPNKPQHDSDHAQHSDDDSFVGFRPVSHKRDALDRSTPIASALPRLKSMQSTEQSSSSRSSTPTRLGRTDRSAAQRTQEGIEIDHPTTHLNISKPLSAREINPAEDGQSSGRSSPGLSLHPSDFSEEEKAPRKTLLDLDKLNWRPTPERPSPEARPARWPSPEISVPSDLPTHPRHTSPAESANEHTRQTSNGSEVSVTLSFSSLADGGLAPDGGPSTSSPIKQRTKPSLRADEQRLKRLREAGALRKSPSPVLNGPGTFISQAKAHMRASPEEPVEDLAASIEGPLLRPSNRRESDDRDWEKVTPLNSVISLDSKIHTTPSRQEHQDRMRTLSKGIEAPLKSSPSKVKIGPTTSGPPAYRENRPSASTEILPPASAEYRTPASEDNRMPASTENRPPISRQRLPPTSAQYSPRVRSDASIQHVSGLPSPTISDEVADTAAGLPIRPPTSPADTQKGGSDSDSTIRQLIPRLPSPVPRDPSPATSTGISREPSALLKDLDPVQSVVVQTNKADMSSFMLVDKAALLRSLEKAQRLQNLVDAYEEQEKTRQVDLMTMANTAQNAQSPVVAASAAPTSILRTILLILAFITVTVWAFEYGRTQAAQRHYLRPTPPLLASLTSMYDSTHVQRTLRYMSLRRPEIGYYPVEWVTWSVEALDYFLNGPYY